MRTRRALIVLALAGVAACSDDPAPMHPEGASYSGGHTLGSGGGAPADTGAVTTSSDTTGRGGHTLGSGG